METSMNSSHGSGSNHRRNRQLLAGIILILFGLNALLERWFDLGSAVVLSIGLALLVWGSLTRRTGGIIPGGVLTGIGLGILANEGPWGIPEAIQNGVFLLCFACGWFLIALLSAIFTCVQWWALIPGGIMAALGLGILATHGALRLGDLDLIYAGLLMLLGFALLLYNVLPKRNE
jgi:hypothetical protein